MVSSDAILFGAGLFIGALLRGDRRHSEAYPLVRRLAVGSWQFVPQRAF